ncbi:uncharacterized protein K02A2.6-like [Rhagoletis pomonella]|uniref:uncharacterized protein K02A2.6-like n=1 Tax=Rhagoletis pomonella TaxID=28610 RepID=UPI001785332F|nr:uncharacterized protein K02A2.6-like [Rhagoletis pomonella]
MPVVKISSLKLSEIKELLSERNLETEGHKNELILRLSEAVGADVIDFTQTNVQCQINELREMFSSVLQLMQSNINTPISVNASISNSHAEQTRLESPSTSANKSNYSVKEIAETIPDFDPTNDSSITVEQFVDRVNGAISAYKWEEKCLLLTVYSRLKGAAKLWFNSADKLYSNWNELSQSLCEEFSCIPDEADIHYKMSQAVRRPNENLLDYCFRVSALGKRYALSESAIVKYARDGLKHRELQVAVATTRFKTLREFRQTITDYTKNIPTRSGKYEKSTESETSVSDKGDKSKQIICYNCQEKGHVSSKCPKPQRRRRCVDCDKVHPKNEPENCGKKKMAVRKTKAQREIITNNIFEQCVVVNGQQLMAFIDTGSECSMVRATIANKISCEKEKCALKISGFCGGVIYAHAKIRVQLQIDNLKRFVTLFVVDDELLTADVLLGQDLFNDMRAVIVDGRITFASDNKFNIDDFKCGTDDLRAKNEMTIDLDTDVPIAQKPFRVPEPKKEIIADMINELLECDIISKSNSEYASPMILVKKKNGSERLCVDFRRLNLHMRKEVFPMPNIEEQLQNAKQYIYFTVLDLNSGYYQIPIARDSQKYTAFVTTQGLFEFKRMPFGLKNAPVVFQRLIVKIKESVKSDDMMNYMDDILIGSQTINEMYEKLHRVLSALRGADVTLNIQKCEFLKHTIEFLGHELTPDGIAPGLAKTLSIRDYKTPTGVTEVRQFLGLSGYFRKFVPGYALIAAPLNRLLRKNETFVWTEYQESAFNKLKTILVSRPVMTAFRVDAEHQVHTDASSVGLAGVLLQKENENWKPVIYYSRATTDAEKKYHSYELETLAVVESVERFRYYIYDGALTNTNLSGSAEYVYKRTDRATQMHKKFL